ncbi:hypothetical protein [Pseudoalteromonas rubra]|uniref:Uncharacterized protein n=1 Tax=Pseudoalteromonas rubra TaxID=43658 RepID=A0A0U3IS49_9GAMM|nr:hypothetical protein [Pseudoalteromonas rubra]ALU46156.1 hypothetical protein AT705_24650 [Pseudoalteromonas rubra]
MRSYSFVFRYRDARGIQQKRINLNARNFSTAFQGAAVHITKVANTDEVAIVSLSSNNLDSDSLE